MKRYISFNQAALLYSFRIVLGCLLVWGILDLLDLSKKEWALISVIVVSEPDFGDLLNATFSRVVNTIMGGIIGVIFIVIAGVNLFAFILAVTVSVLISTSFKNYPASWKLAPVTVAIVMVPAIARHSEWQEALNLAATRIGEVIIGCAVALVLGIVFSRIRQLREKNSAS